VVSVSLGPESNQVRLKNRYPVVVHRWFAGGEGWAFSPFGPWSEPGMKDRLMEHLGEVLRKHRLEEAAGLICPEDLKGQAVVYYHIEDPSPLDPKVKDRHPTILVAAVLPAKPREKFQDRIFERLRALPIPSRPGPDPQLGLEILEDWLESSPTNQESRDGQTASSHSSVRTSIRRARRYLLMMGTVAALGMVLFCWWNSCFSSGITAGQVHDRLLKPLGVEIPQGDAFEQKVLREFSRLYCQEGMIRHYLPDLSDDPLKKFNALINTLPQSNGFSGTSETPQCCHPDGQFLLRVQLQQICQQLKEVVSCLPEESSPARPRPSLGSPSISKTVNAVAVAKKVKEKVNKQSSKKEDRIVADSNAIGILEDHVVKKLQGIRPLLVSREYPTWFAIQFRWDSGTQFPWDESDEEAQKLLAPFFQKNQEYPRDICEAAEEMMQWLKKWNVRGITDEDVKQRPWFVGRCFVEFLSLKHIHIPEEKREALDRENSLIWQYLKKLPEDGWEETPSVQQWRKSGETSGDYNRQGVPPQRTRPHLTGEDLWKAVEESLNQSLRRLDLDASGSTAAKVQRIGNAIQNWPSEIARLEKKLKEEISQLEKVISQLENEKKELEEEGRKKESEERHLHEEWQKVKDAEPGTEDYQRMMKLAKDREEVDSELKEISKNLDNLNRELNQKREERKKKQKELLPPPERSVEEEVHKFWQRLTARSGPEERQPSSKDSSAAEGRAIR